jgi:hypothetical protein
MTTDDHVPTAAAGSSLDEAVEAIVYDVHPATLRSAEAAYPYGPPSALPPAQHEPFSGMEAVTRAIRAADGYFATLQRPPDFVVPKTFGMSAILGIMTALALLFACLRWLDAYPVLYFFFSVEAIAICVAQMLYGQAPRLASVVTGAVILPVFTVATMLFTPGASPALACLAIAFIPFGALLGYLTGTCAAGIFLVMDYLEPYLQGRAFSSHPGPRPTA